MAFIDLHIHSTASDGTYTPTEIVNLAKESGLSAIALTDHDTVEGIEEAMQAASQAGIRLITGIELSCQALAREVHMLGYFYDYKDRTFLERLEVLRLERADRNQKMLDRFVADGFPITWEKLKHDNPDTVVNRAHFARVLVEEGYVPSTKAAFDKYLGDGKKYYIPRVLIDAKEAIRYIHEAGGLAVLAHPCDYKFSKKQLRELIGDLKEAGLDGIEVYHSGNYEAQSLKLKELAHEFDLVYTGGSDFHGENKPDIKIGIGRGGLRVHESLLDKLEQR